MKMRATAVAALLCMGVLAITPLAHAEAERHSSVDEEQTWLVKRRQWLADRCSRKPKDPRCRRYLQQRAAMQVERTTVILDCESDPYDKRCINVDRMQERQLRWKMRSELGAYCRENPDVPRCQKDNSE